MTLLKIKAAIAQQKALELTSWPIPIATTEAFVALLIGKASSTDLRD